MKNIDNALAKEITSINTHLENVLKSENERMQEIIDWILQARGKQIRPKLVCLCAKFGRSKVDVTKMAALLEIIHTASLVHDDIIDRADMRRGFTSVQKKFGAHMAVYAGDYMMFCVAREALEDVNYKNYAILYKVVQKMCFGEIGQDSAMFNPDVTIDEYVSNITGKTALLFESACELGALTSKATDSTVEALRCFGKNLGLLFQIHDDLLDYYSTEEEIGKPILQDFYNGIYTMPVIYSLQDAECKKELVAIADKVKEHGMTDELSKQILAIVKRANGIEKTREKSKEYYDEAVRMLDTLPDKKEKKLLHEALTKLYNRI